MLSRARPVDGLKIRAQASLGVFQVKLGAEFIDQHMHLRFPVPILPKFDGFYRTYGFPSVSHSGFTLANSNHNLNGALSRVFDARFDDPESDFALRNLQHVFIRSVRHLFAAYGQKISQHFSDFDDFRSMAAKHHDKPHAKRLLRKQAFSLLCQHGYGGESWLRTIWDKLKREEYSKSGKFGRIIGDYGVSASLVGFVLTDLIKKALSSEDFVIGNSQARFIAKPDHAALRDGFQFLIDNPGGTRMIYFSDDSCISVNSGAGVKLFNMDISSCDKSHTSDLFDLFKDICPKWLNSDVQALLSQLAAPFKIVDINDRHNVIRLIPILGWLFMHSGWTGTTIANNLANLVIFLSILGFHCVTPVDIILAAAACGYVVTLQECSVPEKLQFLKHSPVYVDGRLEVVLNLGVLLRLSGNCVGDLPGRGDLVLRARQFQHALLAGAYPRTSFVLLDRMKASTHAPSKEPKLLARALKHLPFAATGDADRHLFIPDDALYRRYDLTSHDIAELNFYLGHATVFDHVHCDATSRILQVDYELPGSLETPIDSSDWFHPL